MKHSIRVRFTLIFVGLMAAVLVVTWIVNSFFLEQFYTQEKLKILEAGYQQLNAVVTENEKSGQDIFQSLESLYSQDGEETPLSRFIRNMSEKYNTAIVITDSLTGQTLWANWDGRFLEDRVQQYILGQNDPRTQILADEDNYQIQKSFDRQSKNFYLESWGYLEDNRTVFIMSMPVASIRERVDLSNQFMTYVGVAALVVGSVVMYITTKKVTPPIQPLSALSERMSELDFDARYQGTSQDEIGILGNSMNTLSEKLKETIRELQQASEELQKDIEENIRIDEARKDFIANVSHELKTPIALIQGYAEGLTEGMAEDEDSRNYYCEVIMDEANKMNKMVKQLLTLTALEFGNDMPVLERFDIVALIKGILSSANILLQQHEARVEFDSSQSIFVTADEFKIEEVVTNYLNNALNHLEGEKRIQIRVEEQEREVRVTVFNTGNHIPQEDLGNLWTKFYKVDKARTRAYGGSGIGLSIVKAIMDSHHKECGVANVEGGVEFWFTLEKAPEQKSQE